VRRRTFTLWIWSLVALAFALVRPPVGVVGASELRAEHADGAPARVDQLAHGLDAQDDVDLPVDDPSHDAAIVHAMATVSPAVGCWRDAPRTAALARGPPPMA